MFGVREVGKDIEIVAWGARARAQISTSEEQGSFVASSTPAETEVRNGCFGAGGWQDTPVFDGHEVNRRGSITGPAIIREDITTIVIPPGQLLEVLPSGDYRLSNQAD